jgi:short chain dehydrogenase
MTSEKNDRRKIALVTGANRGLGFETCRQLALLDHTVILSARDFTKGEIAAKQLIERGLDVIFYELHRLKRFIISYSLLCFHIIPTFEELWIVLLFLLRTLSLFNFYYPFIKPIAKPADIPPVRGIPKLVVANDSMLWSLKELVVAFAIVAIVPSILSQLKEAIC